MTGSAYNSRTVLQGERPWRRWELALLAAALALLQVGIAGYAVGVGNQSIQIPYLLHLADPALFAQDPAIADTVDRYPSWAYRALAPVADLVGWMPLYAALHLASAWAFHAALLALALRAVASPWPGALAGLMLAAGHHRGVAGGETYVPGFTHTWLGLALALWAVWAAWERRWLLAGVLLGLLFDLHALLAGYATLLAMGGALAERRTGDLRILAKTAAVAVVVAAPTLWLLLFRGSAHGELWFELIQVRSSHHSHPLSLWSAPDRSIPRLAMTLGFAACAVGALDAPALRRRCLGVVVAFVVLLVVGVAGTGSATVLKAQLWRSSALVVPLALLVVATGAIRAWRLPGRDGRLQAGSLALAVVVLAVPALGPWWWPALALACAASLLARRMTWPAALVAGPALGVPIVAAFALGQELVGFPLRPEAPGEPLLAGAGAMVAVAVWLGRRSPPRRDGEVAIAWMVVVVVAALHVHRHATLPERPWVALQRWARDHTRPEDRILTPLHRSGFRIHSRRSVVTEWRDGTQIYPAPAFAATWWDLVERVQPGIAYRDGGRRLAASGMRYEAMDDAALLRLCDALGANWVVLPAERESRLVHAVTVGDWQLRRSELQPVPEAPEEGGDPLADHRAFMAEVVEPNIRRHRTGRIVLDLRDPQGRAIKVGRWELALTDHAFGFGCGVGHFVEPPIRRKKGYKAPVVDRGQLAPFTRVFNHSTIPYSAKWIYLEPEPGVRDYDDLDAYLAWCEAEGVTPEFHFVTGYPPAWLKRCSAEEKQAHLLAHARALIERYGDRIPYWQVVNEKKLLRQSPAVFELFREHLPQARLGISDCARFYSDKDDPEKRRKDLLRGLKEVHWLREQGVELDFFAVHGHRPFGLYADPAQVYATLDAFAAEDLRLHISEFGIHQHHKVTGDQAEGRWDAERQAAYYEAMFRIFYSHPAVDVVNLWGFTAHTWMRGAGFLDPTGEPKPAFRRLERLIREEWGSRAEGRLGLAGRIEAHGHHGTYRLRVTSEDGPPIEFTFEHRGSQTALRAVVDRETGAARIATP